MPMGSSIKANEFQLPRLQESESKIVRLHIGRYFLGCFSFSSDVPQHYPPFDDFATELSADQYRENALVRKSSLIELSSDDIRYLTLVKRGLSEAPMLYGPKQVCLNHRIPNWPFSETYGPTFAGKKSLHIGVALSSLLYGGLHLLAWPAHFSTMQQALAWRISGVAIISGSPALVIYAMLGWIYKPDDMHTTWKHSTSNWMKALEKLRRVISRWWQRCEEKGEAFWFGASSIVILVLSTFCLLYVVARVYLIVEAFISLGQCPEQVYMEPEWSRYFPHFS